MPNGWVEAEAYSPVADWTDIGPFAQYHGSYGANNAATGGLNALSIPFTVDAGTTASVRLRAYTHAGGAVDHEVSLDLGAKQNFSTLGAALFRVTVYTFTDVPAGSHTIEVWPHPTAQSYIDGIQVVQQVTGAPEFRSKGTAAAGDTSLTPSEPGDAIEDDLLILALEYRENTPATWTAPAGWVSLGGHKFYEGGANDTYGEVFWIRRGAAPVADTTVVLAAGTLNMAIAQIYAIEGVDPDDPAPFKTADWYSHPDLAALGVTPVPFASIDTPSDDMAVGVVFAFGGLSYYFECEGLCTERAYDESNWGDDGGVGLALGSQAAAGATGVISFIEAYGWSNFKDANWGGFIFSLPAPAGTPTSDPFADDFTGDNNDPWDVTKWNQTAGSGGGDTIIIGNKGQAKGSAGNANSGGQAKGKQGNLPNQTITGLFQLCETGEPCGGALWLQTSDDWAGLDHPTEGYGVRLPSDSDVASLIRAVNGIVTVLDVAVWPRDTGTKRFEFRRQNNKVRFKIWDDGENAPNAWTLSATDTTITPNGSGAFQVAYTCPLAPTVDACAFFDDIVVVEDNDPPVDPPNITGGGIRRKGGVRG